MIISNDLYRDYDINFDAGGIESDDEALACFLLNDGPVLKTCWTVYDRQFPDGQRELCVSRSVRIRQNGPLPLNKCATRGESEKRVEHAADSARRARQAVRLRCKAISADRMITLTYRENMQCMARLKKDFDLFRRRFRKCGDFHYIATVEKQERGAFHIHIAVHGRQVYQLIRSIWQSVVGPTADGKTGGQINVRDPHKFGFGKKGAHKLAAYISKYISKDADDSELNKKRYWTSRGIVVPENNYYQLPYGTDCVEAFGHVMRLACETNDGDMVFFGNDRLGMAWFACGPS
ncbi:MAG: hypothetical protein ACHP7O_01240 [Burkholderiales bacterium]